MLLLLGKVLSSSTVLSTVPAVHHKICRLPVNWKPVGRGRLTQQGHRSQRPQRPCHSLFQWPLVH